MNIMLNTYPFLGSLFSLFSKCFFPWLVFTAQDRREMLQEIMRRGTSSLGTDVPSEREINRLAARTEEEFWLFEKMDEERRKRERYMSRLMEESEVPDWVYAQSNEEKSKKNLEADSQSNQLLGKRRRKEVIYADLLSDVQWMKAVEGGEDLSKISAREKKRSGHSETYESASENMGMARNSHEQNNSSRLSTSEEYSEDMVGRTPRKLRSGSLQANKDEGEGDSSSWQDKVTWKPHKRKRSSMTLPGLH